LLDVEWGRKEKQEHKEDGSLHFFWKNRFIITSAK
jgi:hypothetical protein